MLTIFNEADSASPAVLMSPLLNNKNDKCLVLSFLSNTSFVHVQVGISEKDATTEYIHYIKEAAFGNPWMNDISLGNMSQENKIQTTLPKGIYHVVFRVFGKAVYVKVKSITEHAGACETLALNGKSFITMQLKERLPVFTVL